MNDDDDDEYSDEGQDAQVDSKEGDQNDGEGDLNDRNQDQQEDGKQNDFDEKFIQQEELEL